MRLSMQRKRVLVEKAINAKIVFKGVVVEIKNIDDKEIEIVFPESINHKELISFLESVGAIKRKFTPDFVQEEASQNLEDKKENENNQNSDTSKKDAEVGEQEDSQKGEKEQTQDSGKQRSSSRRKRSAS
jgi:hypothetical protein